MRGPYTLRFQGHELPAESMSREFSDCREYNAGMLYRSACHVASRISQTLDTPVSVVGSVGSGKKKERVEAATYSGGRR